jgi:hypothetical protein
MLLEALGRWHGSQVVVRVLATAEDELMAIFTGRLQARSDEKHPALFWPLESPDAPKTERPGIYLHPGSYEGARIHEGDFVVEFVQAGVKTNIRRIDEGTD